MYSVIFFKLKLYLPDKIVIDFNTRVVNSCIEMSYFGLLLLLIV